MSGKKKLQNNIYEKENHNMCIMVHITLHTNKNIELNNDQP